MTTINPESLSAEPRWRDDADLYLGPRVPAHIVTLVVVIAVLIALGITLAIGL